MALSKERQKLCLEELKKRCKNKLTAKKQQLLTAINEFAAARDISLGFQSDEVINIISKNLEIDFEESSLPDVVASIYSEISDQFDRETAVVQRRHRDQGSYDAVYIHQRTMHDQLQDHDMDRLMPQSYGNIEVLASADRYDPTSLDVQDYLMAALKNEGIKHIFIPVGPGHWRGIYLTKPDNAAGKYELELFDPFGPKGASGIKDFTLNLLAKCGIKESQITITLTGPTYPQRDVYACGDFTCAYSHKKMKEHGAPSSAYNQDYLKVLETQGNKNDVLRQKSRELSQGFKTKPVAIVPNEEMEQENLQFSEMDKREFLVQLGKQLANPDKIDKVVLDKEIAKIKSTFGTYKFASLRELEAYKVFNADGSINKSIAALYEIQFDEKQIKKRLESYGLKHLSFREMIIFESVISSVIKDLTSANNKKEMMLEDELNSLANEWSPSSRSRKEAIRKELEYVRSHPPKKGLAKECFAEFGEAAKEFKLTEPSSMELAVPAKQMVGMGYFKFKDINVSISPGPYSARSLIPSNGAEVYESQRDIARFLNNLLANNVTHVFAMGRVFPYAQMQGGLDKDFINYFIPDAHGRVTLPQIPELKDTHITSRPIGKIGRFITYEISINGSKPIQVHHFPIQEKQPLKLTREELAYVEEVGMNTLPEQNIHTHCRDGKGSSTQIAYLLRALNPQHKKVNHEQLIAQMRAEEADASLEFENPELYIIYGTLLKQEIDHYLKQMSPSPKLVKEEHKELLALVEQYQELNATPFPQLADWVIKVRQSSILSSRTKILFSTIKNSTDFLLHAFKERLNPDELEVFFDLQARSGGYQVLLDEITKETQSESGPEQAREKQEQLKKYESLFVARLQNAYLKNWNKISKEDQKACIAVNAHVSETLTGILDAILQHDPKKFTRAAFENLQKEYERCKQRIELLEKVDEADYKVLDDSLRQRSQVIEQLFVLGYDHLEVNPQHIITKMHLIYQRLGELNVANELSPQQWDELKKQFTALKAVFNFINPDEEQPDVLLTLDNLFQGKREHITHPFKLAILQNQTKTENLENFVGKLGFAVLEAAFNELPKEYFGESADGAYSKEILQLFDAMNDLAGTYKNSAPEKIDLLRKPKPLTETECEPARQQVLQLIAKHVPFFITSSDALRVRLENLDKDFSRLEKHSQLRTHEFQELKTRFAALRSEYLSSHQHDEVVEPLIAKMEVQIQKVVDLYEEEQLRLDVATKKYSQSLDNLLRINAIKSGTSQSTLDEIDYFESRIEKHIPKSIQYPKPPTLIVFDIDDVLVDMSSGQQKRVRELINVLPCVLEYAEKQKIKVVLTTNHSPSPDTEEQELITNLKKLIAKETTIDISDRLTYLNVPLRQEKETIVKYLQNKISSLQQEIERLKEQIPAAEDKEKLESIIKRLQSKLDSLNEKSVPVRLSSGKLLNLDVIRHAYRIKSSKISYQTVEEGVLDDFKIHELTKNIGISDFVERKETWNNLFELAKTLIGSQSLPNPKPSLQTIIKDLIFDANRPEMLQNKYAGLRSEAIDKINADREYFIRNIPKIDSFYQDRLAVRKSEYESKALLNEEEIVFFEADQDLIDQAHQLSNYRAIKLSDYDKDSFRYLIDLNYEMGAYNGVIAYLNEDKKHAPVGYGRKGINKTLESYLSIIPNFAKHEFHHSPVVLQVKMSTIVAKLPELSSKEAVQKRYREQFFEAAIERFDQLPAELQDDFLTHYYDDANRALNATHQKFKKLIQSAPELKLSEFMDELRKLKEPLLEIIKKDEQFAQGVSPTFISSEARLLGSMVEGMLTGNVVADDLDIATQQVRFKEGHDKSRAKFYRQAIANQPRVYLKAIHPTLEKMELFNKAFVAEQYASLVEQQLAQVINKYKIKNVVPSLPSLLNFLQDYMIKNDPEKNDQLIFKIHSRLPIVKQLCGELTQIISYQNRAHHLKGEEAGVDYSQSITALLKQVTTYTKTIESSEEYKAKVFLDNAEQYLLAKDWNVGFQWTPHIVKVEGEEKKIPATVAQQLEVIKRARENNNYVEAKKEFLQIGQEKELSWTSSNKARKYYSLFKHEEDKSDEILQKEFSKSKKLF
ncbi:hypothetical protein OQJ26_18755 [Legionella sp. PATHC038]|uniref:hypothetical protein n=1 Tax=Legionella sheltonii TaxID=2992041 RepID=UPI002243DE31|nr:hypothetical protein [Legionella sp. PATHC038]MCW8400827.1 hypothetical protein [Legionella sp. PATHC038]